MAREAHKDGRRLVAPLMGLPGVQITGHSIKVSQMNVGAHFGVVSALTEGFKPDLAFFMMDLSVEAGALGLGVRYPDDEAPSVEEHPVKSADDLIRFDGIDILQDVRVQGYVRTMEKMVGDLPETTLKGGYITGPYTLSALLTGAEDAALNTLADPDMLHRVIEFSTEKSRQYADALIRAGADVICILEPTAMMLSPAQFREFSGSYCKNIIEYCHNQGISTIYHICGNTMHLIREMCDTHADGLSLDSCVDLFDVSKMTGPDVVLIGNVDPASLMLYGSEEEVRRVTRELLERMEEVPNFILSTGCDLPPGTPLKNIEAFMAVGRAY